MLNRNRWLKVGAMAAVLIVVAALAGTSFTTAHAQGNPPTRKGFHLDAWGALIEATKDVTGLTTDQIKDGLAHGKSLAEIINAVGGGVDKVEANAKANLVAQIEDAVTSGKISRRLADWLKDHLDATLDRLIHRHLRRVPRPASSITPTTAPAH